jgi:hypothetical protein
MTCADSAKIVPAKYLTVHANSCKKTQHLVKQPGNCTNLLCVLRKATKQYCCFPQKRTWLAVEKGAYSPAGFRRIAGCCRNGHPLTLL